ncbi:hypothetical protein OH491_06875 [Termitidicoccus mucosus]|uniref:Methyltransferase n=1 Tax=Termitidicoccus mucosus TaxID=1184151 RepID=A0A178IGC9_9BACT|nr:methyltransferase [Opitutaceae bacterium TSB47]
MTSRELVKRTLEFSNKTRRAPRQIWFLPWAEKRFPAEVKSLREDFPADIVTAPSVFATPPLNKGDPYEIGDSTDAWGAVFTNAQRGVIGEVKHPLVAPGDDGWDDTSRVHFPVEWLTFDRDAVNRFCASTDKFVMGDCCPRPFEQLQFLRGSPELYMDLVTRPAGLSAFLEKMHAFYCDLLERWAKTDVDGLMMMDDWGSQQNLLINPRLWEEIFKPLYRDYIAIARGRGKKIFMHSDGMNLAIYPHLVELGLDAINSQIFCIGLDRLAPFRGKISFWGEIDRQQMLPHGTPAGIDAAVRRVRDTLWAGGGCIAQCEFGPGARPENVRQVFQSWEDIAREA